MYTASSCVVEHVVATRPQGLSQICLWLLGTVSGLHLKKRNTKVTQLKKNLKNAIVYGNDDRQRHERKLFYKVKNVRHKLNRVITDHFLLVRMKYVEPAHCHLFSGTLIGFVYF